MLDNKMYAKLTSLRRCETHADQTYRNATLTIVVSAASSVKDGFLHRRSSTLHKNGSLKAHPQPVFKFRSGVTSCGTGHQPVIFTPSKLDEREPWYGRGWTLQEMILSGRRLQFRGSQTTWLCHCVEPPTRECDGGLAGNSHTYNGYRDSDFQNHHFDDTQSLRFLGRSDGTDKLV